MKITWKSTRYYNNSINVKKKENFKYIYNTNKFK